MKNINLIKVMLIAFALLGVIIVIAAISTLSDGESADTVKSAEERGVINVLVLGNDSEAKLSDVIMLVSFNMASGDSCVMQIPRDTYLNYTTSSYKKINGAPRELGAEGFCSFLSEAIGVEIDYYISLTLDAVAQMVDTLGGIEVDVPCDMDYEDPDQRLSIHIKAGMQRLDGASAVKFLRYRSGYVTGDLGRVNAQKLFMSAFAKRLGENKNPLKAYKMFKLFLQSCETNITEQDVYNIAGASSKGADGEHYYVTAPGEAIQSEQSGAWYYVLSASAMSELLESHFAPDNAQIVFDKDNKFVDKRVKSFYDIYKSHCEYKIYSDEDIENNIIDIH